MRVCYLQATGLWCLLGQPERLSSLRAGFAPTLPAHIPSCPHTDSPRITPPCAGLPSCLTVQTAPQGAFLRGRAAVCPLHYGGEGGKGERRHQRPHSSQGLSLGLPGFWRAWGRSSRGKKHRESGVEAGGPETVPPGPSTNLVNGLPRGKHRLATASPGHWQGARHTWTSISPANGPGRRGAGGEDGTPASPWGPRPCLPAELSSSPACR